MSAKNLNPNDNASLPSDPGWMTKRDLARRWKQSVKTVERRISERKLAVHHFGRVVRIALKDVLAFEETTGGHRV
jgi:hypothetical protein